MIPFSRSITAFKPKNEAASNIKLEEILKRLRLDSKVEIYERIDIFSANFLR